MAAVSTIHGYHHVAAWFNRNPGPAAGKMRAWVMAALTGPLQVASRTIERTVPPYGQMHIAIVPDTDAVVGYLVDDQTLTFVGIVDCIDGLLENAVYRISGLD